MFDNLPKVALLGRPNVGKSTLFNRLIRSNRAITHDRPGVTRDRMEGVVYSEGEQRYALIDTGGVTLEDASRVAEGPVALRGFEHALLEQAKEALQEATLLCLVVDAREGLTPFDRHLADFLRKKNKPLLLVVNKVDGEEKADLLMADFHELGFEMIPCSASHGFNVRTLEEELLFRLTDLEQERENLIEIGDSVFSEGATKRQLRRLRQQAIFDVNNNQDEVHDEDSNDEITEEAFEEELQEAERVTKDTVEESQENEDADFLHGTLRIALLGRPNAGKSSIVNAMVRQNRMIVSDIAGTTRDSVDIETDIDGTTCVFVDTAGVRRRSRITDTVERYSVNSSIKSTTKAHVTLLVLNAEEGITQQDKRLIDLLYERKTPFMVLINKSDLIPTGKRKDFEKDYKEALLFCQHVPVLFISALKRKNLKKIVPLAEKIRKECTVRIPTGQLNRAMTAVLERHQPPVVKRARAKFFYLTQAESTPPTFVFFVNSAERVLPSYARYLERSLRRMFGIDVAPMRVHFRSSHKKNKS